jgi:hypothetical protein
VGRYNDRIAKRIASTGGSPAATPGSRGL